MIKLSGILGCTAAAGVTYLLMGLIALDAVNIVASLTVGTSMGFLVGSVLTILDRNRPKSMLHSTVSGGVFSLGLVGLLVGAIIYASDAPTQPLTPAGVLELVSIGLIGIAGGAVYRLIVDYQRVRDFLALLVTSAIGAAVGIGAYGFMANTLAGIVVAMPHLLVMSLIVGSTFGLLYAIVHFKSTPSPESSVITGAAFVCLALLLSISTGMFVGWSATAIVAVIAAPFFVGGGAYGGAYMGSLLRR